MKTTQDQISFIYITAIKCLEELKGNQDSFKRFLYCSFDKIYMCFESLNILHQQLEINPNVEYSMGIILRSVLMNCIMIQNLRFISLGMKTDQSNYNEIKALLDKTSLKFIADGTDNIIKDFEFYEKMPNEERIQTANKIAKQFPGVFTYKDGLPPKLNKEYKVNLRQIFKDTRHPSLPWGNSVYNHYSFYSKYDHLSHWSSEFSNHENFEGRKKQLESTIAIIFTHVRDLLFLGMAYYPELSDPWNLRFQELDLFGSQMIVDGQPYYNGSTSN